MAQKTFLIAGAAGNTGRSASMELLKRGVSVRALVRTRDDRAAQLVAAGAEVVVADLLDADVVRKSFKGIEGAYFVYPIIPHLIEAASYFVEAARTEGVESVVNMSQISSRRDAQSHAARDHWVVERLFDWSGLSVTHLRPTLFAQNFLDPESLRAIIHRGVISFPFGVARHAPLAAEDQGRLIASIFADPAPHRGKTYPLHGSVEFDYFEIAELIGKAVGKPVRYDAADIEEWRARAPLPAFLVQHLCAIAVDYQAGIFSGTDTVIEDVTGTAPMTFEDFLHSHKNEFDRALQLNSTIAGAR